MASAHPTSTNSGKRRKSDKESLIDGIDDIPEDALAELEDALMLMDDDSPNATAVTGTSNRHAVALPEARHAHDRACFGNDFFVCCSPRKPKGAGKQRVKQYAPKAAAMPPPAPRPPEPPPPQEETFGPMAVMKLLYPSLYS